MARKHDILYVNFYTDGSAARKIAPAVPQVQPQRKPRAVKQKKIVVFLDPVAVCSIVVAAVLLIMMAVGLNELQAARLEEQAMEEYWETLMAENESLSATYQSEIDLAEVEKTALALGMVPKDQVESVQIRLESAVQTQPTESFWQQVHSFLTNLFA